MNMFARFDENPAMTLQDIKETKRYRRTDGRTDGRTHARTDNVKTVYPTTNKVCGGYKEDPLKIESTRVVTTFLPLVAYGDFSRCSRAANS